MEKLSFVLRFYQLRKPLLSYEFKVFIIFYTNSTAFLHDRHLNVIRLFTWSGTIPKKFRFSAPVIMIWSLIRRNHFVTFDSRLFP
ncbi:hypothetical protein L9F63_002502, partial [Diploptera punctata]